MDFRVKKVKMNEEEYSLHLWDTAGQERFRTITKSFFRGANGVVVCFDLSKSQSVKKVGEWMNYIQLEYSLSEIPCVLVGTKSDLPWDFDENILQAHLSNYQVHHFMTSSKNGTNVFEMFDYLLNQIRVRIKDREAGPIDDLTNAQKLQGKNDEEKQLNKDKIKFSLNGKMNAQNDKKKCEC